MDGILFLFLALLVVILSIRLSYYADVISKKGKFGSLLIGGIVLAIITSLPEAVTGISSIIINNPYLAIGDVLGSNIFNLFIIAGFDLFFINKMFMNKITYKYVYLIGIIIYVYIMIISFFKGAFSYNIFNLGYPTIIIIVCYFIYVVMVSGIKVVESEIPVKDIKYAKIKFIITAILMILISILLTIKADRIAYNYPIFSSSVIGAFLLGITTSLPEVVTVYTLLKIDSYNLAISNIIGSNMFNLLILAICDIFIKHNTIYNFNNTESMMYTTGGLYFSIIIIFQILRRRSINKITYIIPSIIILMGYIIIWYLQLS